MVASGMNVADCQHSCGVINDDLICVKRMHMLCSQWHT
jgi:hypothetical protein